MRKKIYSAVLGLILLASCQNSLDLYPLAEPSAEKWYSNETEIQLALNDLYRIDWWQWDEDGTNNSFLSDDGFYRQALSEIKAGTVTSFLQLYGEILTRQLPEQIVLFLP